MGAYPVLRQFSLEEYLRLERAAESKSEYIDGQIFAMAGGTAEHSRLKVNATLALGPQLERGKCRVWDSDLRVAVASEGPCFYPDLSIICGQPKFLDSSRDCAMNPVAVFEVLSPSTKRYDRETKAVRYREIPSLRHIVLISQSSAAVEHHLLGAEGKWEVQKLEGVKATLELCAVGASLPLDQIYREVAFPAKRVRSS